MTTRKDFWCVVALDYDKDEAWVLDQSQDARDCDVLDGSAGSDNCLTSGTWIEPAVPGLYRLELSPWGYQGYEGEWDTGIDVTKATLLVAFPPRPSEKGTQVSDNNWRERDRAAWTDEIARRNAVEKDCPVCGGDCAAANPPVMNCPLQAPCGGQVGSEWREPCAYCGDGKRTGLPGNACENCMNTGYANPTAEDLK